MKLYNDHKTAMLVVLGLVLSFWFLMMAAMLGGIKSFLLALWILFGFGIFLGGIILSIDSGLTSKKVWVLIPAPIFDLGLFRYGVVIFFLAFLILTGKVWGYLESTFPNQTNQNIPVSEMPLAMEESD